MGTRPAVFDAVEMIAPGGTEKLTDVQIAIHFQQISGNQPEGVGREYFNAEAEKLSLGAMDSVRQLERRVTE